VFSVVSTLGSSIRGVFCVMSKTRL
jgi:hypothetical protein